MRFSSDFRRKRKIFHSAGFGKNGEKRESLWWRRGCEKTGTMEEAGKRRLATGKRESVRREGRKTERKRHWQE